LHHILPLVGKISSGGKAAEYQHLTDSIYNFPSPERFQAVMEEVGFVQCSHEDIFHDVVHLYKCSVGNKNECVAGQSCEALDRVEQVEGDTNAAVPNPNNILIVPENGEKTATSTEEAVTAADAAPSATSESAVGEKIKKKSMAKKKKLIKD
jgi:hypothetical protein